MTDKQIIIDGVDVSRCEFYNKDDKTCREVNGKYDTDICDFDKCGNPNCYYKQLKRSEAKREAIFVTLTDSEKAYRRKEQECEDLKTRIEELIEFNKGLDRIITNRDKDNTELTRERNEYLDWYFLESQKVLSLRKVLKEINGMATHCLKQDICTTCDNSDGCYIEDEEIPTYDICKLILQKISEVEDE